MTISEQLPVARKKVFFFLCEKSILEKVMRVRKFRKDHFTLTREKGNKNGSKRHILSLNCRHLIKKLNNIFFKYIKIKVILRSIKCCVKCCVN